MVGTSVGRDDGNGANWGVPEVAVGSFPTFVPVGSEECRPPEGKGDTGCVVGPRDGDTTVGGERKSFEIVARGLG